MNVKKFWDFQNQKDGNVLFLYGVIAEDSWFDDDVTPTIFKQELESCKGDIEVCINSPGGDCIAAARIYNMLMDYKGKVTVKIDGVAASAASVIAMAGEEVLMNPTALMMIHNPATIAIGDSSEMKKAIQMLNEVKESIINAYEIKTNLSREKLSKLMDAETWLNSNKAIEHGFADKVMFTDEKIETMNSYSFSRKVVENRLINKLPKQEIGSKISDLEKRLDLIKY